MVGYWVMKTNPAEAASGARVFEIRTYTTNPGKLDALNARFRDHTTRIFKKHGMQNVGYWVPQDEPAHSNTLVYVIAHKSRDDAKKSWDAFRADPEWQKVQKESEAGGRIPPTWKGSRSLPAPTISPVRRRRAARRGASARCWAGG